MSEETAVLLKLLNDKIDKILERSDADWASRFCLNRKEVTRSRPAHGFVRSKDNARTVCPSSNL